MVRISQEGEGGFARTVQGRIVEENLKSLQRSNFVGISDIPKDLLISELVAKVEFSMFTKFTNLGHFKFLVTFESIGMRVLKIKYP